MPRIRYVAQDDTVGFAAAIGFKAGMGHAIIIDDREGNHNFGKPLFVPYSVIALPPLKVVGIRAYKIVDGYLTNIGKVEQNQDANDATEIRALVQIVPKDSGFSQKKPFVIEVPISGKTAQEKIEFVKKYIGKELDQREILSRWVYVDVIGVTKGKGFQGPVKRFGIKRKQHKSRKSVRAVGAIGPWHPASVMYSVPRAGHMGYHRRTIYNLRIIGISKEPNVRLPTKAIKGYYILIKGSVPGPVGRPLVMRKAVRLNVQKKFPTVLSLSTPGVNI